MPFEEVISGGLYLNDKKIMDVTEAAIDDTFECVNAPNKFPHDIEINFSFSADVSEDFLDKWNSILLPPAYDISYLKLVQARKHKKKRINKKWLKKYGYRFVMKEDKGWHLKYCAEDESYKFIKEVNKDESCEV